MSDVLKLCLGVIVVVAALAVIGLTRATLESPRRENRGRSSRPRRRQHAFGPWLLTRASEGEYVLRNVGTATVHEIEVSAPDPLLSIEAQSWAEGLDHDQRQTFRVTRHKGLTDSRLMISWRVDDEQQTRTWTVRLPLR